ncbi:MAG: insulinase family protein [Pedobacter sp.]|nr:MAG: insulinase family protein [Pedobacter sp.]
MLKRLQSPPSNPVEKIDFLHPVTSRLDNGIPVYVLNGSKQEMIRLEVIINHVNYDAQNPLRTMAVSAMLKNGTATRSAREIADTVDYFGAFLDAEYATDHITVTLYALSKHFASVLPVLVDILTASQFPQSEVDIYKRNSKQKLSVSMQKNDFIARKKFAHELFGNTTYGADINENDYDNLEREHMLQYFKEAFVADNFTIIASGKFEENEMETLNAAFGQLKGAEELVLQNQFTFVATEGKRILVERPDAIQSAIRIGMITINRKHPDFPGFSMLSCVLGGYFGSRLMANIREDKGYTYGIGSGILSMKHAGQFYIATEVGTAVCESALEEIYKEIEQLKQQLIPLDELELVRNYMLGSLLGSLENVFSHANKFKNLLFSGLDYDYYERYIKTIKLITPEELKDLANKYLKSDGFIELVVGKK